MRSLIADLRYAARELRRRPAFALTAVLSLALGIGATSAVFRVIDGVLLNLFPYVGAERMTQLALKDTAGGVGQLVEGTIESRADLAPGCGRVVRRARAIRSSLPR